MEAETSKNVASLQGLCISPKRWRIDMFAVRKMSYGMRRPLKRFRLVTFNFWMLERGNRHEYWLLQARASS